MELYYVLVSAWGHKLYHPPFSILFIMFVILILVTAFITVALTYFQLAAEDHRWWWRSFLCGGATGLFLYGYCAFFFIYRSDMRGFYQVGRWCDPIIVYTLRVSSPMRCTDAHWCTGARFC